MLTLFAQNGREQELTEMFNWVIAILHHGAFLGGTGYYCSPDAFLHFVTRLVIKLRKPCLRDRLVQPLQQRLGERVGMDGGPASLTMRVLACKRLGIPNSRDLNRLREMQCEDGSWPVEWIYKYSYTGLKVGNRGLTTALAVQAIETPITGIATIELSNAAIRSPSFF